MLAIRELMLIQLHTAFLLDAYGRLVGLNEQGSPPPPRLFTITGTNERIIRTRSDITEGIIRDWLACATDQELRNRVESHGPIEHEYRGPAYVLPDLPTSSTDFEPVRLGHVLHPELVARGWKPFETAPYMGVVRDGLVVAVCYSSRDGAEACEAGVETATEYRSKGLGLLAVRAWANAVQSTGRLALYSTTLDNIASQRIAEKLGANQFGEIWHLT